jgi:hypothetical protein
LSRTRVGLVGIIAAGLMLMSAGAASATPEPPTTSTAFETIQIGSVNSNWDIQSPTTTVTTTNETAAPPEYRETGTAVETNTKSTETESRSTTDYRSQIQQPINPDGTSTWPAKRGVIPVQFKLTKSDVTEERTKTVTESRTKTDREVRTVTLNDTHVSKTPSFVSICSDGEGDPDNNNWSALNFDPVPGTSSSFYKLNGLNQLRANFSWLQGSSHGGSLRWTIRTSAGDIDVYYGDEPNWLGTGGNGANLVGLVSSRFDDSEIPGGTSYNTWDEIKAKYGNATVNGISLIVDSCWQDAPNGDQSLDLTNVAVSLASGIDNNTWTTGDPIRAYNDSFETPTTYGPWTPADPIHTPWVENAPTYSDWNVVSTIGAVPTNAVPAFIKVVKQATDTTPIDVIEELSSAQGDTTGQFRQVDSKYLYNLKAESLGKGNFKVYMVVDGNTILTNPGVFELR